MSKAPRKILVVDDDQTMIRLAEKLLKNDGYQVIEATNGNEAIAKAAQEIPDLILLDVLMPDIDGKEVVRRLRQNPATAEIPVVFMTVTIDLKADKGNETVEVDGVIYRGFAKPIHNRKVLSVIRKEINKKVHGNK